MPESMLTSVISVLPVTDHAGATAWYGRWIGRGPDVEPMEGIVRTAEGADPAGNKVVFVQEVTEHPDDETPTA
ncbi:hypothetical protein OCAE111667_21765 [Occultella aeris]|uniref:Glyoxalase n=1 Tax=Occultella aeris TaxID=2761496 RepID=A0A7M4DS79_9MICO|nr:hypothetical protein [Occultella aeris]VZO40323.1 hypothetical protein HALOF300_05027 [Occultella aeris]